MPLQTARMKVRLTIPVAGLLLGACASNGSGKYLMVMETYHGPVTWHKFRSLAECEGAVRKNAENKENPPLRCATKELLHSQYSISFKLQSSKQAA